MEVLGYKPSRYWILDTASPFTDLSGYGGSATRTGTETKGIGLVSNAAFSQILDSSKTITFDSPVYRAGYEANPFSLAATILPVNRANTALAGLTNRSKDPTLENDLNTNASSSFYGRPVDNLYVMTFDTTDVHSGSFTRKMVRDSASPATTISGIYLAPANGLRALKVDVTPGEVFSIGVWAKANLDCRAQISTNYRTAGNVLTGSTKLSAYQPMVANEWTLIKFENIPVDSVDADIYYGALSIRTNSGLTVGGETTWVDSVMVNSGPTLQPFFYGDTPGAFWNGAQHGSTSTYGATTGPVQILSNQGKSDGLYIDGTTINFSTAYVGQGSAKCSYDLQFEKRADVVGVHTRTKNSLYVNGKLVDEVDITAAQQAATYDAPDTNLYAGNTVSSQGIMLNAVGIFGKALAPEEILSMASALNRRFSGSVTRSLGGTELQVSTAVRRPMLDVTLDETGWRAGTFLNSTVEGTMLVPNEINNLSVAGSWERSFDISNAGANTTIDSGNIQWGGNEVSVFVSINGGLSWSAVSNATNIPALAALDPTDKQLMVRVLFNQGVDDAYIDNFQINVYTGNTYTPLVGRTITYTNAVNFDEYPPMDLRENWGVKLANGSVAFGADSSQEVYPARTIEVWLKRDSTSAPTYSFSPTTTYVNGISGGSSARGEWALYHFTLPSNANTFTISGDVTVGRVSIYDTVLSAGTISDIYTNYTGQVKTAVDGSGTITITEPVASTTVYGADWSISAA